VGDLEKLFQAANAFETFLEGITVNNILAAAPPVIQPGAATAARKNEVNASRSGFTLVSKEGARGGLVLVVDDDEGNRDVLSRRLLRDGYEVMLAETGRQALRMARRYNFDIVLLDIMMPEMDGITVLAEIRKDPNLRHLPVVMVSSVDETESVVRCLELGADDYLPKPFNPVILRARLNSLMERKRLQDNEARRTAELEKALAEVARQREKGEELLLNILPASVARELQADGIVQPMYFEDVTIVFGDFVGFTLAKERLPADELVTILHEYFTAFDLIMKRYGLQKLKTIGDSYMFAGGLPVRNPAHPVDAILAAFEMLHATRQLAGQDKVNWQLRIGVHTGPVIAGVVGIHKFAFDIWGDAVNFSSRMESSGTPGRVHLSANTYARVKDFFDCEKRERLKLKDGREVETYFVNGIAAGLLSNRNGVAPLESFARRYRTYFRMDLRAFPDFMVNAG